MLLAVSFLEFLLCSGFGNLNWTALIVPAAIVALGYRPQMDECGF